MKVSKLSFSYGKNQILKNINFEIKSGEMIGIVGESGAGKSTLLRLLGGLIPLQEGWISEQGKIGFIFQDFHLFPHLNVLDNLSLALKVNQVLPPEKIKEKANKLLADFGILDKADAFVDQLSGGEQQRVAIARALMLEPEVLLIDEATSNLDPKRRDEFMFILKQLKQEGMSIVLISHDYEMMQSHAERLLYLEQGEIVRMQKINPHS